MKNFARLLPLLLFFLTASAQNEKTLAEKILNDHKLDTVSAKAKALLSKGFNAGDGYPQVWIRDLNTFIETSCKVYNTDTIRKNLLTFLYLQQSNGEIVDGYVVQEGNAYRILPVFNRSQQDELVNTQVCFDNMTKKYQFRGLDDPNIYYSALDTTHVGFKNTVETDQETSLIQAIGKYIRITSDRSILQEKIGDKTALERLTFSIDYLLKNRYSSKYKLLTGATTQDWGDVQIEGGAVVDVDSLTHWSMDAYDNAMFIIALNDMISFADNAKDKKKWSDLKQLTSTNTKKYLWDASNHKFIPHLYVDSSPFPSSFDENKIYYHGATAVAIEAGLLSKEEIRKVNKDMMRNVQLSGVPSIGLTIYPPYPENIYPGSKSNKEYNYQNGGDWTWFGGRMIQQLIAYGFVQEAYDELQPMINQVINNNGFYEWFSRDNKPNGSPSFKGAAGVLDKAIDMLHAWV